MTTYVDNAFIQADVANGAVTHSSSWSHLTADTQEELHDFIRKLGLRRGYFQDKPNGAWHYDLTKGKRAQAIKLGAVPVDWREFHHVWMVEGRVGREGHSNNVAPYSTRIPTLFVLDDYRIESAYYPEWEGNDAVFTEVRLYQGDDLVGAYVDDAALDAELESRGLTLEMFEEPTPEDDEPDLFEL